MNVMPRSATPISFATLILLLALGSGQNVIADDADFSRSAGPILAKRCAGCHNGTEHQGGLDLTRRETMLAGGESGAAIVPGNAAESLIWQRIADDEMPPKKPLQPEERAQVQAWLAAGARWSGGALDPLQYTTDARAGYDWWSLRPLAQLTPPATGSSPFDTIDALVDARRKQAQLTAAPPADRRTLIRRLYFGLLGLPPQADEVAKFVAETSPNAYEALVDRLLASPAYGQRWARHWLDVVRFGESQGFERDRLRTNAWRYRDWVVDAFNRDLPYDEFVRLQIAGDVLRPNQADAIVATGFLVAGPYDEVGQKQQSAAMRAVVRQDELEDLVGTVGQTFLGLTVNCSRCHDHKFDPIRQAEYYRLAAALAGVQQGEARIPADVVKQQSLVRAETIRKRQQLLADKITPIEQPLRAKILAERRSKPRQPAPQPIANWEFDSNAEDTVGGLHLQLHAGATLSGGRLILDGAGYATSGPLGATLKAKTLEAWVALADLDQRGGGVIAVSSADDKTYDAIVFGEREPRRWMSGSNSFTRTQNFQGSDEQVVSPQTVHVAIVYGEDGKTTAYRNGQPYGKPYTAGSAVRFTAGKSYLTFGVRHLPIRDDRLLRGAIDRARLYDRALTAEEVAASAGADYTAINDDDLRAAMSPVERDSWAQLKFEFEQLQQQQARLKDATVHAVQPQQPETTHVLHRGNPNDPREFVTAGGIASLRGVNAEFGLDDKAGDAARRSHLAAWITDQHNPLFARVMVNRLWHYHFGVGLVETPNDFGFNGGRPSHPELLDWLASELVRSGWSVKHVQRLIVNSATYRQSSQFSAAAAKIDAGNRLLWRKTPQRLDAETLRDTLLALSGELDTSLGGPGFYEFTTYVRNSQFYDMQDAVGASFQRRTIYRTWVRSARSQFLDVFDCPDPSTKAPQRAVTTTPLQALSLLNNSFVLRAADSCALSVRAEAGDDPDQQVSQLFERAFNRQPASEEQAACTALVRKHGLAALCRVIFNSNELLYVD
jgi:hypothetical protein